MRIATISLATLLTAASTLSPLSAQSTPAPTSASAPAPAPAHDSILMADLTRQISPNVWVIPDAYSTFGVPNVGIIIGTRAALVIDPGLGFPNGAIALAETLKLAPGRALYIVTTHVHPEHDLGANAFPASAKMIRSTAEIKDIDEFGLTLANTFAKRSTLVAELLQGATFRKADITFDKEYSLDLGGVQVRITAMGANHTAGDTTIFVNPDGVLFAGDTAMSAQPSFASPYSSLTRWLTTLDALDALQPKILVPSHGPIRPSGDTSYIAGYRTYLTMVRDRTAELKKQGLTVDQIVATLTPQMAPTYPNADRLAGAIKVAYKEAP